MSAEGKKKRGESGQSKAKSSPHRLNGLPEDWQLRRDGVYSAPADHAGTHMVRGAIGGLLAASLGYAMYPSNRVAGLIDRSMEQCPEATAAFDAIGAGRSANQKRAA